jgi:outer membrane protein OmpA-like peptidoglycan-associated protein
MLYALSRQATSSRTFTAPYRWLAAIAAALLLSACMTGTATSTSVGRHARFGSSPADIALYMDAQEYELREALADHDAIVARDRDAIILRMSGAEAFEPDKADIRPAFRQTVTAAARILTLYDHTLIDVAGHTDSSGSMIPNMALSLERAEAVASLLMSEGIAESRITPRGLGPMEPLADNDSAEGRQLNRRVELTIRPMLHLP